MEDITLIITLATWFLCMVTPNVANGTTVGIRDIFIGRCRSYQEIIKPYPQLVMDCDALWDSFMSSFVNKDPCTLTSQNYNSFIESALSSLPENKTLFWSGTYRVAHDYAESGHRFITLEDTLLGYMVNGVTWCGQTSPPGIDYQTCPPYDACPPQASTAFWGRASAQFASLAKGTVTILLDGSNRDRPAYSSASYFAKFELPMLSPDEVKLVNVLVVHAVNEPYRETCTNGTLPSLLSAIKDRGLVSSCRDNPKSILHLLCVDSPSNAVCRMAKTIRGIQPLVG